MQPYDAMTGILELGHKDRLTENLNSVYMSHSCAKTVSLTFQTYTHGAATF